MGNQGFDKSGYSGSGFDKDGFDGRGYDKQGFARSGYDERGFDANGYDRSGFNERGFDREGFDAGGYNADGFDKDGYDRGGEARPIRSGMVVACPALRITRAYVYEVGYGWHAGDYKLHKYTVRDDGTKDLERQYYWCKRDELEIVEC